MLTDDKIRTEKKFPNSLDDNVIQASNQGKIEKS